MEAWDSVVAWAELGMDWEAWAQVLVVVLVVERAEALCSDNLFGSAVGVAENMEEAASVAASAAVLEEEVMDITEEDKSSASLLRLFRSQLLFPTRCRCLS